MRGFKRARDAFRPVRALLLLPVALLLAAGCIGAIPRDAHIVHGLATVDGGGMINTGYHCDGSSWSDDPPRAHLYPYSGPRPDILLVRNVSTDGGRLGQGRVLDAAEGTSGQLPIPSLVDETRTLGRLGWSEEGVTLDGEAMEVGATRTVVLTFDGERGRGTETLALTYWGIGRVTTKAAEPGFACM